MGSGWFSQENADLGQARRASAKGRQTVKALLPCIVLFSALQGCDLNHPTAKTEPVECRAGYQRFVPIMSNTVVAGLRVGAVALDTKTGLVCATQAYEQYGYPLCIDLYKNYSGQSSAGEKAMKQRGVYEKVSRFGRLVDSVRGRDGAHTAGRRRAQKVRPSRSTGNGRRKACNGRSSRRASVRLW